MPDSFIVLIKPSQVGSGDFMLTVLSVLPGTGKTTIGKALAAKPSASYVCVDKIEQALKQYLGFDHGIDSANLKLGNLVVADSVNTVPESRQGWRDVVRAIEG